MNSTLDYKPAGFFRRMVALFYDLILIIALCVGLTLLITYALNTEVESPYMYLLFLVNPELCFYQLQFLLIFALYFQ